MKKYSVYIRDENNKVPYYAGLIVEADGFEILFNGKILRFYKKIGNAMVAIFKEYVYFERIE